MIRILTSLAMLPLTYAVFVFVSLNPDISSWTVDARLFLTVVGIFMVAACYTFPGWSDRNDR